MVKNQNLRHYIEDGIYDEKTANRLETVGICAYTKYGHDFYNYSVNGSPIDIECIDKYLSEAKINLNANIEDVTIALLEFLENQ